MPENDFEKQVQQLFDGFKLKPSDDVWLNVHERVKEKKKSRKYFFWLPVLLLLMLGGAGAYFMFGKNYDDHHKTEIPPFVQSIPSLKNREKENKNTAEKKSESGEQKNAEDGSRSGSLPGTFSAENETQAHTQAAVKPSGKGQSDVRKPLPVFNLDATVTKNNNYTTTLHKQVASSSPQRNKKHHNNLQEKDAKMLYRDFSGEVLQQSISLHPSGAGQFEVEKPLQLLDRQRFPSTSTPVKLGKKKAWEFGVNATAGVSKVSDGLSGIFSNFNVVEKSAMMNDALIMNNTTAGLVASQNNNYLAALPPSPTPVKPGLSWGAGASAKWYIKSKFALTGAIQYSYYSTNREAGALVSYNYTPPGAGSFSGQDRYAGIYGGINGGFQYTNKYHLLEVPLGIQWQLNKGIKLAPIQLNTGVSVGWLISTNALHYDKTSGSYYQDKFLFNKVQAGLFAGVSAKLFQHSNKPLYIGPFVQYNFSNLLKSPAEASQNLIFGGIKAEWILWKK